VNRHGFFSNHVSPLMESPFQPILDTAKLLTDFPHPWFISGGWAIDLFLGKVTRNHSDIEVGIYRRDQQALHDHFIGWHLEKALANGKGEWFPWETGEELSLPIFQIKAKHSNIEPFELEFFLNEREETHWLSRRHDGLARPIETVNLISELSIPILAPDIQLLYKAKHTRSKDQADFILTLPRLDSTQRNWLAINLRKHHAGHVWLHAVEDFDTPASAGLL
jgi:hypothetical protein